MNMFEYFQSTPPAPSSRSARLTSTVRESYAFGPNIGTASSKDVTRRICFTTPTIMIYSYPTRGGIIILNDASPADLDFLALDRTNPPMLRHDNPEEEDAFCQQMLLLGAKWWDSIARYRTLNDDYVHTVEYIAKLDDSNEPWPTLRERRWVSVAWPSTGELVVSEFGTNMWGVETVKERVPDDVARLRLCTNMDEKAQMLKDRFRGRVWGSAEDYCGDAFLNCWGRKEKGEVGEFQKTWKRI